MRWGMLGRREGPGLQNCPGSCALPAAAGAELCADGPSLQPSVAFLTPSGSLGAASGLSAWRRGSPLAGRGSAQPSSAQVCVFTKASALRERLNMLTIITATGSPGSVLSSSFACSSDAARSCCADLQRPHLCSEAAGPAGRSGGSRSSCPTRTTVLLGEQVPALFQAPLAPGSPAGVQSGPVQALRAAACVSCAAVSDPRSLGAAGARGVQVSVLRLRSTQTRLCPPGPSGC